MKIISYYWLGSDSEEDVGVAKVIKNCDIDLITCRGDIYAVLSENQLLLLSLSAAARCFNFVSFERLMDIVATHKVKLVDIRALELGTDHYHEIIIRSLSCTEKEEYIRKVKESMVSIKPCSE